MISPRIIDAIRTHGMHKLAAAMADVPEFTLKEAARAIGTKARLRHREYQKIAEGIDAFAAIAPSDKHASAWGEIGKRAIGPAMIGAGVSALPHLLSSQPIDQDQLTQSMLLGGITGGVAGGAHSVYKGLSDPAVNAAMAQRLGAR